MWSLEDRERGRVFENKQSVMRQFSSSVLRTPIQPPLTPLRSVMQGSPGDLDRNGYLSLPEFTTIDTIKDGNTTSFTPHLEIVGGQNVDNNPQDTQAIESDIMEFWKTFEKSLYDSDCTSSIVKEPTLPSEDTVPTSTAQASTDIATTRYVPELSYHGFDESSTVDTGMVATKTSGPTRQKRPPPLRTKYNLKRTKIPIVSDPTKSMYHNAVSASIQTLRGLLDSPKVDVVNEITEEVYAKGVSLHMLQYFCGGKAINFLLHDHALTVPQTHASRDGIIRVIRYMRRWCQNPSVRPTGELRTPSSIKEGIATSLACRYFGLDADAQRMEDLVVQDYMGSPGFFVTDEDVELIWCGYEGSLQQTPFGDALVWFILECVMGDTHALADEIRWMLEQEEYEDLKARIRCELKRAEWRGLQRNAFLRRCREDRKQTITSNARHIASGRNSESPKKGISDMEKRLSRLPAIFCRNEIMAALGALQ